MSLTDELLKHVKENSSLNPTSVANRLIEKSMSRLSVLDEPIGQITSRDQIIDPYDLVQQSDYRLNRRGKAQYESDLARAKLYAQQQEAAYKEWFESPEQVYARERQAGRNPDLTDVMEQSSGHVDYNSVSPLDGIPTNGEVALNALSSFANLAQGISSLSNIPLSILSTQSQLKLNSNQSSLLSSQKISQDLANIIGFESASYSAIQTRLADAINKSVSDGTSFDYDSWFADESNFVGIAESYLPSGVTLSDSRYNSAWNRARNAVQKGRSGAYDLNSHVEHSRSRFSSYLAHPYHDDDILMQIAFTEPLMKVRSDLEFALSDYRLKLQELTSPELAAGVINAENKYKTSYFNGIASFEDANRVLSSVLNNMAISGKASIIKNYKSILDDPNSSESARLRAEAVILSGDSFSLSDWLKFSVASFFVGNGNNVLSADEISQIVNGSGQDGILTTGDFDGTSHISAGRSVVGVTQSGKPISFGD